MEPAIYPKSPKEGDLREESKEEMAVDRGLSGGKIVKRKENPDRGPYRRRKGATQGS